MYETGHGDTWVLSVTNTYTLCDLGQITYRLCASAVQLELEGAGLNGLTGGLKK